MVQVKKFHVENLKDSKDITNIRSEVQTINGVHAVRVDNVSNTLTVEYDNNQNENEILSVIGKYETKR